jgi:hypothetical protein
MAITVILIIGIQLVCCQNRQSPPHWNGSPNTCCPMLFYGCCCSLFFFLGTLPWKLSVFALRDLVRDFPGYKHATVLPQSYRHVHCPRHEGPTCLPHKHDRCWIRRNPIANATSPLSWWSMIYHDMIYRYIYRQCFEPLSTYHSYQEKSHTVGFTQMPYTHSTMFYWMV